MKALLGGLAFAVTVAAVFAAAVFVGWQERTGR